MSQAQNEEKKKAEEKKKLSAAEAEDWKRGANERASSREEAKGAQSLSEHFENFVEIRSFDYM